MIVMLVTIAFWDRSSQTPWTENEECCVLRGNTASKVLMLIFISVVLLDVHGRFSSDLLQCLRDVYARREYSVSEIMCPEDGM